MIEKELEAAMNRQVVNELYASNAYLTVASYMDMQGLKVLAGFFFKQSEEERTHALKFVHYLLDVGGRPVIGPIPEPKTDLANVEAAVQRSLEQEIEVTRQINELMALAQTNNDYAAVSFLRWFVDEQVEEQAAMNDLLALIRHAGPNNLLLVEDRLMKQGVSPINSSEA